MSGRIGLVGYACDTGLGVAARDFFHHLPFERFLVIPHPRFGAEPPIDPRVRVLPVTAAGRDLRRWLSGLDGIFSIEICYLSRLWPLAKQMGLRIALMPNAEWIDPADPNLQLVDTFIAPTRACHRLLSRIGFARRSIYIPHPVDTHRFAFRERVVADVFLHCRGWGGYKERKGTDIVFETARRCPQAAFLVRAQSRPGLPLPPNLVVKGPIRSPERLYHSGDVAIQPSRWEGVGLQILEAMSCGIPVIVPDAPPMNEYPADRSLCVPATRSIVMLGHRKWPCWETDPARLAQLVSDLNGAGVSFLSRRARARMERRSWTRLLPRFLSALEME